MKNLKQIRNCSSFLMVIFALWSCEIVEDNNPPIADAGDNFELEVGETATLDGSNSSDEDGDELTYSWEFTSTPSGSNVNISNADSPMATFIPDEAGEYAIRLTVEDPMGGQGTADVVITAKANEPPVAVITDASGQSISSENGNNEINIDNVLRLHGTESTDPEDDELSYSWELISGPSEGSVNLENVNTSILSFSADFAGDYTVALTVDDGKGNTNKAEAVVTVLESENESPSTVITDGSGQSISSANGNDEIVLGNSILLSGVESTDPEGDELTYSWAVSTSPEGSNPTLENESTEVLTLTPDMEGEYDIALTVDDGEGNTNTAEVTITITPNQPPVAVITDENGQSIEPANNNNVMSAGNTVQFYGDQSSDPENDDLSYSWAVASSPAGSTPTLENENTAIVDFTADTGGDYIISLTVTDDRGNEDVAEITIISEVSPVIIDANVDSNVTWENVYDEPNLPDYRVTGNIDVNAALTIEPGVVIEFVQSASLKIRTEGSLNAVGTAQDGIVMTGVQKVDGFWQGIFFNNTRIPQNELSYVTVEYAGESSFSFRHNLAAVVIGGDGSSDQSEVAIKNCVITNSGGAGIDIRPASSFIDFENNSFANNASSAVKIFANHAASIDGNSNFNDNNGENYVEVLGGTVGSSGSWTSFSNGSGFLISNNVSVTASLTLDAGALLVFKQDVGMSINDGDGSLTINGSESNKVNLIGDQDISGYWKGVFFNNTRVGNVINHAVIKNAGSSSFSFRHNAAAITVGGSNSSSVSAVSVSNTLVSKSGNDGIEIRPESSFDNFSNNEFADNEGRAISMYAQHAGSLDNATKLSGNNGDNNNGDVAFIRGGNVSTSANWVNFDDGSAFLVSQNFAVTAKLTVDPGATIKFDQNTRMTIQNDGILEAIGTASDQIRFIGKSDVNGYWIGIFFNNSISNENIIDNAIISNGGSTEPSFRHEIANICIGGSNSNSVSNATITNCTISNGGGYGIDIRAGSTATINNNTYSDNMEADVNQQ